MQVVGSQKAGNHEEIRIKSESRGGGPKKEEVLQKAGVQQTHPSAVYRKGEEQEHIQGAAG
jgi:hypothetical protein